ncbi:MAG: hypothetical protein MUF05_04160 [Candidatus Omnitrophica bacterium]|jgi:hypothetical protein|nr:hypothetical protein [Candidatus Omnitrophota bacterium]
MIKKTALIFILSLGLTAGLFAQADQPFECSLDYNANTINLPAVFKPGIDLSGSAKSPESGWPVNLAASSSIELWAGQIGLKGFYRLQYNLWEILESKKDKQKEEKLSSVYEDTIKKISDAGGTVILNIFGMPAGYGKILDQKSPPANHVSLKALIKSKMRVLSCDKRYNIWYEVWSAPDADDFFLGRRQDYLLLYRAVAESAKELEAETKIHIPVGGPGTSWWFQNSGGNNILYPHRSLIYDLIRYCYDYRLPLDFISWHAYTSDPKAEKELTRYNKIPSAIIRDWLFYFRFDRSTPLIISEWNYDAGSNILAERADKSFITASFIPARIKYMYESGIDYQVYFALEDFYNEPEGVVRNVGVFASGVPKSAFIVFKMLKGLSDKMFFSPRQEDPFVGVVATKKEDGMAILLYNYIDPQAARNYISRNIAFLSDSERKYVLDYLYNDNFKRFINGQISLSDVRSTGRVKNMLKKAKDIFEQSGKAMQMARNIKMNIKNLKKDSVYVIKQYLCDDACVRDCQFAAAGEKEVVISGVLQQQILLKPYSVCLVDIKKKAETENKPVIVQEEVTAQQPVVDNDQKKQ